MNDKHRIAMGPYLAGEESVHDKLVSEDYECFQHSPDAVLCDPDYIQRKTAEFEKEVNRMLDKHKNQILTRKQWQAEFLKPSWTFKEPSLIWPEIVVTNMFTKPDNLYYVAYDDGKGKHVVFFTNNYFFTSALGDSFVHVSTTTRGRAVPRPGCEDGNMDTLAKFKAVLHSDARYLYSHEELIDFLDELGRVKH